MVLMKKATPMAAFLCSLKTNVFNKFIKSVNYKFLSKAIFMRIKGNITGVPYQALLGNVLPSIDFRNLDINSAPPTFWLNYGLMNGFAVSKWVSPKRTRSYPYERVYNTLSANKKITIIPIIKDEGSAGDRDFIQWDTISLMSLLDIFVIFAYYSDAERHPTRDNKITNQKLDDIFIKSKIAEIASYHSSALHWNLKELNAQNFHNLIESVKTSYNRIGSNLNISMHNVSGIDNFRNNITTDMNLFKQFSRDKAQQAQQREFVTVQPKELLSTATKAKITIKNYLGGEYFFTVDEVKLTDQQVYLIEAKHSNSSILPSLSDIKDGLLKLVLYCNLENVTVDDVPMSSKAVLKLTSKHIIGGINNYSDQTQLNYFYQNNPSVFSKQNFISELFYEANQNNIMVVIGDFSV